MKTKFLKISRWTMIIIAIPILFLAVLTSPITKADSNFSFGISPMYEKIILNPGDSFTGSFDVVDSTNSGSAIDYDANVACYFVDENYNNFYDGDSSWCKLKDWVTIRSGGEGVLNVGEKKQLVYDIDIPEDAVGGGQYAAIIVTADVAKEKTDAVIEEDNGESVNTGIAEKKSIAYLIHVEITGDVVKQGEIVDISVPSFLLSGNIEGVSAIRNSGNTHGVASYKLQVFPLFSNEEIYTNEENPQMYTILPDRTFYNETSWMDTPAVGIFNAVYTVEFEGAMAQVSKLVIKCPAWLLFIIIFVIFALIFYFVAKAKARKKAAKKQ